MFIINWCRIGENRPAGVDARFLAAAHLWHARLRPWRLEMKGSKVWRGRSRSWFHGILAGDEHGFMGGIMMDYGPMAWRRWFFYAFKSYELRRRDETPWPTGGLKWGCPLCSNKGMVIWRDDGGISWGSYYWHLLKLDLWIHSKLLIGLWFFMGVFCWMTKTCRFQTSKHGHRWPSDWRRSTWWFSSTFDGCFSSTLQGFPTFFLTNRNWQVSVGLGETPARTMDDVSACFSVIQSLRFEFSVFQTRAVRRLWRGLKMIDLTGSQIPLLPGSSTCCFHVIY